MNKIMKRGFTLIDVLIVTAIIGIVFGVAVPRFMEARQIRINKALEGTNYPIILEIYSQEEYDEIISAFQYYNKYVNSRTMGKIIKRLK